MATRYQGVSFIRAILREDAVRACEPERAGERRGSEEGKGETEAERASGWSLSGPRIFETIRFCSANYM
jgi:hypothetical protein